MTARWQPHGKTGRLLLAGSLRARVSPAYGTDGGWLWEVERVTPVDAGAVVEVVAEGGMPSQGDAEAVAEAVLAAVEARE